MSTPAWTFFEIEWQSAQMSMQGWAKSGGNSTPGWTKRFKTMRKGRFLGAIQAVFASKSVRRPRWPAGPTSGFSRNVENHQHMLAIYFLYYNFCRVHLTLMATPRWKQRLPITY